MSSETDSTDGCSSNAGPSLCIYLTVVALVMTIIKAALALTLARAGLLYMSTVSTQRGRRSILLHFGVKCVQIGVSLKGVTATTQDGSENV